MIRTHPLQLAQNDDYRLLREVRAKLDSSTLRTLEDVRELQARENELVDRMTARIAHAASKGVKIG